jgi:hypothetical protein
MNMMIKLGQYLQFDLDLNVKAHGNHTLHWSYFLISLMCLTVTSLTIYCETLLI